jgi:signal transduction histidine kinase
VLSNLLDNASKYGGTGVVGLSCNRHDGNIIIRVTDQGSGIPTQHLEAVFQPFYRLDNSRSKQTGGSGLGLAIV